LLGAPASNSLPTLNLTSDNAMNMRIRSVSASDLSKTLLDEIEANNSADIELYRFAQELCEARFLRRGKASADRTSAVVLWPLRTSVEFRIQQEIRGSGWWFREGLDGALGQSSRWSGAGPESLVLFHMEPGHDYALSIRVANAITPEVMVSPALIVNGRALELSRRNDDKWGVLIENMVSSELLGQRCLAHMEMWKCKPMTWQNSPCPPDSRQWRRCGIR
jgi:hypothetical protein